MSEQNLRDVSEVVLRKADDRSQAFYLKADTVEVSVGNNLVARAILSAAGDIAGSDPVLNSVTYQITGINIQAIESEHYPSEPIEDSPDGYHEEIPSDDHNQRMLVALKEAAKQWGPSAGGNMDRLEWGGQSIPVVITSFSAQESASEPMPGKYTADMELTHISAYVG